MKILVATDKPFAAVAVNGIKDVVESAGIELALLEKYGEKSKLANQFSEMDKKIWWKCILKQKKEEKTKQS